MAIRRGSASPGRNPTRTSFPDWSIGGACSMRRMRSATSAAEKVSGRSLAEIATEPAGPRRTRIAPDPTRIVNCTAPLTVSVRWNEPSSDWADADPAHASSSAAASGWNRRERDSERWIDTRTSKWRMRRSGAVSRQRAYRDWLDPGNPWTSAVRYVTTIEKLSHIRDMPLIFDREY